MSERRAIEWGEGDLLGRARSLGVIDALDQQFADRLAGLYARAEEGAGSDATPVGAEDGLRWALAVACRQEAAGHVCADLPRLVRDGLDVESEGEWNAYDVLATHASLDAWIEALTRSSLVEVEGAEVEAPRPIVLDGAGRLYLRRAHRRELSLARRIRERADAPDLQVDWPLAEAGISRFSDDDDPLPADALRIGLARPLSIVTGGPGTGKTTLVARLVALLLEQARTAGRVPPRVRLLTPTGKAAATLSESFSRQRESLGLAEDLEAMPTSAETLHRALQTQTRLDAFGRPGRLALAADVVVVDEASMVDLEMMSRLFEACEGVERIVLLGDPGQLASVDAGAVLAELCEGARSHEPERLAPAKGLAASIVRLRHSHRFTGTGGIGRLARAIEAGDPDEVIALLDDPGLPEIERCDVDSTRAVLGRLVGESRDLHLGIRDASDSRRKLDCMGLYRVLCAHRRGPLGVESIGARLDEAAAALRETTPRAGWWSGRLLLVTRNAPDQDLWNGDVGLVEDTEAGLRALFRDREGGVRALAAGRLPPHESAIAMSVHKSQGSEFDVVDLVLGDRLSPIMTRELLYTGVTRARRILRVHASERAIREMVARRIHRDSGLAGRLWED